MTAALNVLLRAATVTPAGPPAAAAPVPDSGGSFLDALVTLIEGGTALPKRPAGAQHGADPHDPTDPHEPKHGPDPRDPAPDAGLAGALLLATAPPVADASPVAPPKLHANVRAASEVAGTPTSAPAATTPGRALPETPTLTRGFPALRPLTGVDSDRSAGKQPSVDPATTPAPVATVGPQPMLQAPAPAGPAPAAPTPAQPQPQPQPALADALVQLRGEPEGVHELTVQLHPAELGAVQIRASLAGGTLTVTVACADETARHAVTAALPALHHQLAAAGPLDVQLTGGQDRLTDAPPHQHQRRDPDERPERRDRKTGDEKFEEWM